MLLVLFSTHKSACVAADCCSTYHSAYTTHKRKHVVFRDAQQDRLTELRSLGAEGGRGVYGRLGASSNNVGVNDTRRGEFIEPREASDDRRLLGDCTANAPRASSEPADLLRRIGLLGDPSSFSVEKDANDEK